MNNTLQVHDETGETVNEAGNINQTILLTFWNEMGFISTHFDSNARYDASYRSLTEDRATVSQARHF